MKRAIKNHAMDFAAIVVLLVLAIVVSGYILNHERLRFPFIQSSPYVINATFSSAKAVTPGQGQSVRVSGVQVGSVGNVSIQGGNAIVQLDISPQYKNLIHTNATALLRPKTGLDDMFVEVDPGGSPAPVAQQGFTIPVSNTNPVVDPDEILSSLDADSREYLELLVNGAGAGLQGKGGGELAGLLERFLPTHQALARLNRVVAERGTALQQLVHSLQVLNAALAVKQQQIVQLVGSSDKVFTAFANANHGVSQSVAELPATLQQATVTLQKVQQFANILAPATRNLLPAVSEIPAANAATISLAKPITPVLRTEIRPFVVAAQPLVRNLVPASKNLATATPNLSSAFTVLNHLFNDLGYSPGGGQHGYLWWLAWADHNARTLFSIQDANGDFRPLFLQASCATYSQIVANLGSEAAMALNVVPTMLTAAGLCPDGATQLAAAMKTYDAHDRGISAGNAIAGSDLATTLTKAGATALSKALSSLTKAIH